MWFGQNKFGENEFLLTLQTTTKTAKAVLEKSCLKITTTHNLFSIFEHFKKNAWSIYNILTMFFNKKCFEKALRAKLDPCEFQFSSHSQN